MISQGQGMIFVVKNPWSAAADAVYTTIGKTNFFIKKNGVHTIIMMSEISIKLMK